MVTQDATAETASKTATGIAPGTAQVRASPENFYWTASALARRGAYVQASAMLARALHAKQCSSIEALDLQGRIYAQAGSYREAEACWMKAIAIGGRNCDFQMPLERLWRLSRSRGWPWRSLAAAAVAGAGLLFMSLHGTITSSGTATRQSVSTLATSLQAEMSALRDKSAEAAGEVTRLRETFAAGHERDQQRVDALQQDLAALRSATGEIADRAAAARTKQNESLEAALASLTKTVEDLKSAVAARPAP